MRKPKKRVKGFSLFGAGFVELRNVIDDFVFPLWMVISRAVVEPGPWLHQKLFTSFAM